MNAVVLKLNDTKRSWAFCASKISIVTAQPIHNLTQSIFGWCNFVVGIEMAFPTPPQETFYQLQVNLEQQSLAYKLKKTNLHIKEGKENYRVTDPQS